MLGKLLKDKKAQSPTGIAVSIIVVLVGALILVALLPELRWAVGNATNITGTPNTILLLLGGILVSAVTIVIVRGVISQHLDFMPSMDIIKSKRAQVDVRTIVIAVVFIIAFIVGIAFLNELQEQITASTNSGSALEGTLEATLLNTWVLIIVAGMGISGIMIAVKKKVNG